METERSGGDAEPADQVNPVQRSSRCDREQRHGWIAARRSLESCTDINCNTTIIHDGCKMQHHWRWRAGHWPESDIGLRMVVTWRVPNVATVIISIESITDVKTYNRVRAASDEQVQNSSSKKLLNKALGSSSI